MQLPSSVGRDSGDSAWVGVPLVSPYRASRDASIMQLGFLRRMVRSLASTPTFEYGEHHMAYVHFLLGTNMGGDTCNADRYRTATLTQTAQHIRSTHGRDDMLLVVGLRRERTRSEPRSEKPYLDLHDMLVPVPARLSDDE